MSWREFVKDYLNFSRKERIAILALVTGILLVFFLPDIVPSSRSNIYSADTTWFSEVRKLTITEKNNDESINNSGEENPSAYQFDKPNNSYPENLAIKGELFYFDPNKITRADWKRLGLREKTIQTITNYLSKGGKFKKPEDLQKIYGLRASEYERLGPFIKIENSESYIVKETLAATPKVIYESKNYSPGFSPIDVNTADTSAFISLPGIGSKLAARIVNFREKLGGFYSVDQVGETYGLPDSTFQKIKQWLKLENNSVKKININTATVDELKAHPYIKFGLANPIVAYRNEHGAFSKTEDIKKVMAVTEDIFIKIAPYLSVQ